jgi:hypothetical protein
MFDAISIAIIPDFSSVDFIKNPTIGSFFVLQNLKPTKFNVR